MRLAGNMTSILQKKNAHRILDRKSAGKNQAEMGRIILYQINRIKSWGLNSYDLE